VLPPLPGPTPEELLDELDGPTDDVDAELEDAPEPPAPPVPDASSPQPSRASTAAVATACAGARSVFIVSLPSAALQASCLV
jgi:hypothetical protein